MKVNIDQFRVKRENRVFTTNQGQKESLTPRPKSKSKEMKPTETVSPFITQVLSLYDNGLTADEVARETFTPDSSVSNLTRWKNWTKHIQTIIRQYRIHE